MLQSVVGDVQLEKSDDSSQGTAHPLEKSISIQDTQVCACSGQADPAEQIYLQGPSQIPISSKLASVSAAICKAPCLFLSRFFSTLIRQVRPAAAAAVVFIRLVKVAIHMRNSMIIAVIAGPLC